MKLVKVISEIRFETSLLFDDAHIRNSIAKTMKNVFPASNYITELKALMLIDPKDNSQIQIFGDRIFIDLNEKYSLSDLESIANTSAQEIMTLLDVTVSNRIGIRAHFIHEDIDNEKQSSEKISSVFFKDSVSKNIQKLGNSPEFQPRIGYLVNLDEEYILNVNIAFHQVASAKINEFGETEIKYEKTYPLTDLDIFTNALKRKDQINDVFKSCCIKLETLFDKVWSEKE
jgi:hypothetical protein